MKLGLCCMLHDSKFKKGYTGIKKFEERKDNKVLIEATLHNIKETRRCIEWVIENNVGMYRFSSDIVPFGESWNWQDNLLIKFSLDNLKKLIVDNSIRTTIHPSQFCVINSEKEDVISSSFDILEHHYKLCSILSIDHIIIHTGSAKKDYKERFISNFKKLSLPIREKILLENCHSVSILDVIDICKHIEAKPLMDFHHNRVYGNVDLDVCDKVIGMWNDIKPICHISSGKTKDSDKSHSDYISKEDLDLWKKYLINFDIEVEAKLKDLAILKVKEVMV